MTDKENLEELIDLSTLANIHEDTLILIIRKHDDLPISKERLLNELNLKLKKYNKSLWDEGDLDISLALLTKKGFIETE